jgi:hypothetical protein
MSKELRIEMRQKARKLRGLLNLLTDDIYHVNEDAKDFDLICLNESLTDTKNTLQMLIDSTVDLEYTLYLSQQEYSRQKQTVL